MLDYWLSKALLLLLWFDSESEAISALQDYDHFFLYFNRRNVLELRVYFQELRYQVIRETPAYDSESLLGE